MKVAAVHIPASAASPSHPDHTLWVKEQTLKLEVANQRLIGGTLRDAEAENARQLERLANRKRKPQAPRPRRIDTPEQLAKEGVTVRAATKRKPPPMPACKLCRKCIWCKRSIRVSMICVKAREQDTRAVDLKNELAAIMIAASGRRDYRDALGRELPFSRITGHDVDRAVTQGIEWACDRSVTFMGQWR